MISFWELGIIVSVRNRTMHLLHSPYENVEHAGASPHRVVIFYGLAVVTVRALNSYI